MGIFEIVLMIATFLTALVAGLVFAFAVVIMPGIQTLPDKEFIRAFQVMDRIIQNKQPLFMLAWLGSTAALLVSVGLGITSLAGVPLGLLLMAAAVYLLVVQLPTVTINIPLNNKLQTLQVDSMNEPELRAAREAFEPPWNRWNTIRTWCACVTLALLIALLYQL